MNDQAPIGYAVTVILPDRYFQASLYVEVSAYSVDSDAAASLAAVDVLHRLAHEVPGARLQVTQVRRLG